MTETCCIEGCGRPLYVKGMCSAHYQRARSQAHREAAIEHLPLEQRPVHRPRAEAVDSHSKAAYLADVAAHLAAMEASPASQRYESNPRLAALAEAMQARLAELIEAGASDDEKLATLRTLAERTLGRPTPWPEPEQPAVREMPRLSGRALSELAWSAPNGAERGWL